MRSGKHARTKFLPSSTILHLVETPWRTKVQGNGFKEILDEIEANGDSRSGGIPACILNQFKALTVAVVGPADSRDDEVGAWWSEVLREYTDSDPAERHTPFSSRAERPTTLAQLNEKLRDDLSIRELGRLRRRFAFEHHPDRVPATERISASRRLAIANNLIDLAVQDACRKSAQR